MKSAAALTGWLALAVVALAADPPPVRLTSQQRLAPEHLQAAHMARSGFARARRALPDFGVFEDFRAVVQVQAQDAAHATGTRDEVLAAARNAGVRIVMFTDHGGPQSNRWHGLRDGVLLLAGGEDAGARDIHFSFPGGTAKEALRFLAHVEERDDAAAEGLAGLEICSRRTGASLDKGLLDYLGQATNHPAGWARLAESFRTYPDEFFAAGYEYQPRIMARWDAETRRRRFTGIGINDAHQKVAVQGVVFDPYEVSFRTLCTHLLARELSESAVREALREGHCYVAHDWLCDPAGFVFGAVNNLGVFPMGDRAPMQGTTRVMALTPLAARLKLFHNGQAVAETNGTNLTFTARKAGAYRVEAWLAVNGEERPWIYSNPVYLEESSLLTMPWPNGVEATNVEVKQGIRYVEGLPADDAKHKLDLYLPRGVTQAPVFFFVHGGAWRFGDRWQYGPLGQRIAKEGILTIIPSYRLAPKNPHPAQIEDVAAAFAWTLRHIGEYGGDTSRVFVAGHSAGAHLVSLLTLQERDLRRHGFSSDHIRGVIALSGVYDLTVFDSQSSVFGNDPAVRRDASPFHAIRPGPPPFLVSYCERDYPTLPAQAKRFHRALSQAGLRSELFFTPRENHISEMIAMTYDNDPTTRAVLDFVRRNSRPAATQPARPANR